MAFRCATFITLIKLKMKGSWPPSSGEYSDNSFNHLARTPIRYLSFDGLMNNGVGDFLLQDNELAYCKNVWIYKIGKLEKVPGYEKSANSFKFLTGYPLSFLHYYYDTASSTNYQIGGGWNGTQTVLKYRTTSSWSSSALTWTTASMASLSAENYIGKAFIVGHVSGTFIAPASVKGTTYTTSSGSDTDLLDMPKGKFAVVYRDLLYVLNCEVSSTKYPTRAYYCNDPVAGAITWNNVENFKDFGKDDGDVITGGATAVDRMVVFKKFSMWKWDESTVKKIADVGCDSYRSIKVIHDTIYWFNRYGFWRWNGSSPVLISERAKEYIDAIDSAKYDNIVAAEYYKGEYRAYLGHLTVNGRIYKNAWFCFDTIRERCYIRCTFYSSTTDDIVSVAGEYIENGKKRAYFGDGAGYLYKFAEKADGVYADDDNEIDSFFETKLLDHGVPEDTKFTNHMTVFSKNNYGMKVSVDADNKNVFAEDNKELPKSNIQQVEIHASANRFRYHFYEKGKGLSWQFEGMVIETQIKEEGYAQ
jgi:hypothetical protein